MTERFDEATPEDVNPDWEPFPHRIMIAGPLGLTPLAGFGDYTDAWAYLASQLKPGNYKVGTVFEIWARGVAAWRYEVIGEAGLWSREDLTRRTNYEGTP